jgi:hypothetical protein
MPGCFITGQAAGVAAALAAERGIRSRDIAVPELQRRLRQLGAYLPAATGAESGQNVGVKQ